MKLFPNITAKWLGERENFTILTLTKISVSALKKKIAHTFEFSTQINT